MRRPSIVPSLASLCLLLASVPAANAASLTRIETRPVYGAAIVTEEAGVTVYRPLPPLRYLILNPEGRTPLNLTIEDRNVFVQHHYYGVPSADGVEIVGGYSAGLPRVYHGKRRHRHVHRSRPGGYMISVPAAARGK
jgi:hypothetical protein